MRKLFAVLAALLLLCACVGEKTVGTAEYDLGGGVSSLDPQFAEGSDAQTAVANLFLGLLFENEGHSLSPACAESWDVQNNGTRYVFHLRNDIVWSDGTAVTADDFLFAFERMFSPDSPSPYAEAYSEIENASEVLSGAAEMSALGVSAPDERTLVITLSHADCTFPSLLAQTPAMPCSRTFFAGQKGRYGLDADSILTNGAFTLASWTSSSMKLVKNENAPVKTDIDTLTLNLNVSDAASRFEEGVTEACLLDSPSDAVGAASSALIYDRTWSLILNPASETLGDREVRSAILGAVGEDTLGKTVIENAFAAKGLIPHDFSVGTFCYRDIGAAECPDYPESPRGTLQSAFGRLGVTDYPALTLLLCDTEPGIGYGGAMQRDWSNTLSLYVNVETVPYDTLVSRVTSGDFDLALVPLQIRSGDRTGGLQTFVSLLGDEDYGLAGMISESFCQTTEKAAAELLYSAEQTILNECLAMPVCDTERCLVRNDSQSSIWYNSSTGVTYCYSMPR